MDWQSIQFDWNRAKAFLVTAEEGSLSAAARALGSTQPTVGRQVAALEQELETVLFERLGQGLTLTPSGLQLLEHVRVMADAANKFSLLARGQSQKLEGTICISASEVYAALILPPIIKKLRYLEPKIKVEIISSNAASDLRMREADIAIRNFQPTQSELIARKLKDNCARLYATPEYLKTLDEPINEQTLAHAKFVSFDSSGLLIKRLNSLGLNISKSNFPIYTESHLTHWELVKQGLGIGMMPDEIGDIEPSVVRVLSDIKIEFPVWLTTHRELRTSRRVRYVFDLLAKELI